MNGDVVNVDMAAKYGHTTLSNFEVFALGDALLSWMGTVARLGHSSPGSVLDYTKGGFTTNLFAYVIRDFVAWTSGRVDLVPDCEDRIRQYIAQADLDKHLANKGADVMGGAA